jgi:serine/threonine protein phosphatase PrpC
MSLAWVAAAVGVGLVLLLVLRAMSGKDEAAPQPEARPRPDDPPGKGASSSPSSSKPTPKATTGANPAPASRKSDPADAATAASGARGAKGSEEEEPEGTKVASIPPPAARAGGSSSPHVEADVEIGLDDDDDDAAESTGPHALILVTAHGRTDAGRRRKHNEDAYLILEDQGVFVIADGMGGYAAGEVASQLCVDVISEAYKTKTFTGTPDPARPKRGDELVRAIEMANTAILTQARSNEAQHGMGTTVVSARFSPGRQRVYIAHVGDSRLYRIRRGDIRQMTTDHTLGAAGITGPAAAKLSRAVGIQDTVDVDLSVDGCRVGDHYLLCSDGLSKMVPDEMIRDIIIGASSLDNAVAKLVETANERGGRDNVSVIVVRVDASASTPS